MPKTDSKSRLYTVAIIVVVGLWAVAMGAYIARHRIKKVEQPQVNDPAVDAGGTWDKERWYGLYQNDKKFGYGVTRVRKLEDGYRVSYKMRVKIRLMDNKQDISLNINADLDPRSNLRSFEFEGDANGLAVVSRGRMEGNNLILTMDTGGAGQEHTLHFDHPLFLDTDWEIENMLKNPAPGVTVTYSAYVPFFNTEKTTTLTVVGEDKVKIEGESFDAWKVESVSDDHTSWYWLAQDDRRILKVYDPLGFTSLLQSPDEAVKVNWEEAGDSDLLASFMVKSSTVLINPREINYFRGKLEGAPLDGLDLVSPGRQTLNTGVVEITMEQAVPAIGYVLPISASLSAKAEDLKPFLDPGPFIQSDNQKIKDAAAEAIGEAGDATAAVDRLVKWTADNVADSMVFTFPSALDVLNEGKGACKEHTVLFVALARAAGIPARPVSGIVYSETMPIEGFYYHAWAEVWMADAEGNGAWIAVDPTFNQVPADATHIKLMQGDLGEIVKLTKVIGRLKVQVEEYR